MTDLDSELERLRQEEALWTARLGGPDRVRELLRRPETDELTETRERVQRLRALAGSEAPFVERLQQAVAHEKARVDAQNATDRRGT